MSKLLDYNLCSPYFIQVDINGSLGELQMQYNTNRVTIHFFWGALHLNIWTGEIYGSGNVPNIPKNKDAIMNEYYTNFMDDLEEQLYVCSYNDYKWKK